MLINEISQLENRISVLESNHQYESQKAVEREQALKKEHELIIQAKDKELSESKDQINQLLRIIEQITKTKPKHKYDSTSNSKSCDSQGKNSADDNKIVIQEQLEISSNDSVLKDDGIPTSKNTPDYTKPHQYSTLNNYSNRDALNQNNAGYKSKSTKKPPNQRAHSKNAYQIGSPT